jgi:hypothetical protein
MKLKEGFNTQDFTTKDIKGNAVEFHLRKKIHTHNALDGTMGNAEASPTMKEQLGLKITF